ncbi:type II toxin-antitoxin system HipA family toxin [Oxalobacteraceae bacterium A2-2]
MPGRGRLSDVIAKLPPRDDDSQIYNEYVAMRLAAAAGVEVAQCEPVPLSALEIPGLEGQGSFLAVQRYDRAHHERVHVEDACQVLGRMPRAKYGKAGDYQAFLTLLARLSPRGMEDVRQFFLRQAVNTLLGNSDAHLKNFSVLYQDRIFPQLSPAYDIVCVAALPGFAGYGTNVAIDKLHRAQTLHDYVAVARASGIAARIAASAVKSAVAAARDTWPRLLSELPAPPAMKQVVTDRLATLPLAKIQQR